MPAYRYTAKNGAGETVQAVEEAESPRALVTRLRAQGLTVVSVRPAKSGDLKKAIKKSRPRMWRKKIAVRDLETLFRQLATMIDAGLPLVESLGIALDQCENPGLRRILEQIRTDLRNGKSLTEALTPHPEAFSPMVIAMIQAGEESGALPELLLQLTSYLEDRADLRDQVKSATSYPIFIAAVFMVALAAVFFFIIPRFEAIFNELGVPLPLLTRVMIRISRLAQAYVLYELGIVGILILILRWGVRTPKGGYWVDQAKLKLPKIGPLISKVIMARLTRTLGILLDNGIGIRDALDIAAGTAGNRAVARSVQAIRVGVSQGSYLAAELGKYPMFPRLLVGMVSAGESSGTLPKMLKQISASYRKEVEVAVKGLSSIIEPVIIVCLGGVVLLVVLSVYLPIFHLASAVQ